MIQLKKLLFEIQDIELKQIIKQIEMSEFKYIASGDNGRVYKLNNKDLVFKITTSTDEIEVARKLENNIGKYSTFIPVYYVDGNNMYIVANADTLPGTMRKEIDMFMQDFALFSRDEGGEVSIFDFMEYAGEINPQLDNFLTALQVDIQKLGISEFELDFDFRADNLMIYNGKMVMVDW